ncbi:hypothetical protein N2152v2_001014 [Parachlorella kessleri]
MLCTRQASAAAAPRLWCLFLTNAPSLGGSCSSLLTSGKQCSWPRQPLSTDAGAAPGGAAKVSAAAAAAAAAPSSRGTAKPAGSTESWPVVISGGGPTGLTAAMLLSKYGVPSLVLERAAQLTDHPQAHFINMRAMEVFRGLDGLSNAVSALVPPLHQWRRFVYCSTMTGELLGTVDHFKGQTTPYMPDISPEPVSHLAQHRLLPLMAQRAAAAPGVTLRMGHRVTQLEQSGEGVKVSVEGPQGETYSVRSPYYIAADGARGSTRTQLGIGMEGPGGIQHLINVHFTSPELGRLVQGREGMLYFVFGNSTIAVVVAHNIDAGEFVAQVPYFPPLQRPEDFTAAKCAELMRTMAGKPDLKLEVMVLLFFCSNWVSFASVSLFVSSLDEQVRTIRPWTMSGRVASSYQKGRVFLVGDAAHHFPPSGAFGMNTGVCDAHNLAWKLAAVLQGAASPRLLDSYTPERKPVGLANMQLSADNFYEELKVPSAMGLDFYAANAVSGALSSPALSFLPRELRAAALNSAFSLGMAASGPLRRLRQRRLDEIFSSGETLRLQFPKEDLGFVYHQQGAAVCKSEQDAAALRQYLRPRTREAPYEPCTLPGARLPHCTIKVQQPGSLDLAAVGHVRCISTLDLVTAGHSGLTLFLSESPMLPTWLAAAARSSSESGVPIRPVVVVSGPGAAARADDMGRQCGRSVAVAISVDSAWERVRGMPPDAALLVRPDGHVGWRSSRQQGAAVEEGALVSQLCYAARTVMGR